MKPADCLAIQDGQTVVNGLEGRVTIVRDRWGIPHIRAGSMRDAYFAQGFSMTQERAWQIEMIRHMAHGRAAALLNKALLNLDIQNRTLGFGRLAEAEWDAQTPRARLVLEAYAAGINAAIKTQPVPFEFRAINHTMQPWSPVDSLAIIKMVNSGQQWASKLKFGQVTAALGVEAANALIPESPKGSSLIVPSGARWTGATHPFKEDISRAMGQPDGPIPSGGGSNCWVVDGTKSGTGFPIVAGDPHLPMSLPGQWFVVHMECPEFTVAGPCNPGYPGPVFYGHNTKVAWTMTHAQGDRWDVYRERIQQGATGPEVLYMDQWEPLTRRDERFDIREGESVTHPVWSTRHGPVVFGDPSKDDEVLAARWGLADPAHDTEAMVAMALASTGDEAREALRGYDSVSGNYCFADKAGHIGYQYTGRIPRRPAWLVPVPGWDGAHEWDGDVPTADLPCQDNPPTGYLVTANNRTTTPDYPHYLTYMSTRFRADRLNELLEATPTVTTADCHRFQSDTVSVHAREMLPGLLGPEPLTEVGKALQELLRGWDANLDVESAAALAFDVVFEALVERTVRASFARATAVPDLLAMEERRVVQEQMAAGNPLFLVGDASWDAAVAGAIDTAAHRLNEQYGSDPAAWRWGSRHEILWRHNLGRGNDLGILLNVGPVALGGDANTPFNTAAERDGRVAVSVSYRQIIDLADLNAAQVCIPPGNSGQPGSPHYADNVERWRRVEYHPLFIDWGDIEANAEAHLELKPA